MPMAERPHRVGVGTAWAVAAGATAGVAFSCSRWTAAFLLERGALSSCLQGRGALVRAVALDEGRPSAAAAAALWEEGRHQPHTPGQSAVLALGALVGVMAACTARWRRNPRGTIRSRAQMVARRVGKLADCPYTIYGKKDIDVPKERESLEVPMCPLEVTMPPELKGDVKGQRAYFAEQWRKIYRDLKAHGAIVFRDFELSKQPEGFTDICQALQLEPCEDPLHSVAARDAVNQEAGVYEAVNKPARRKFYVGMHNEMVGNRAPGAALFVCFKAAEEGGEFLVADGRKMFKELDAAWLEEIYEKEVMYSSAELPMGFLESLPAFLQKLLEPLVLAIVQQALRMKVDFNTELIWERSDYDGSRVLQVRSPPQAPVLRHPFTGEPTWWGSMHSHAEYFRREREKVFGDEGLDAASGSSRINKTDVYYGSAGNSKIEVDRLKHLDDVTMQSATKVKMREGDLVLLDNYLVMHGRCPFEGTRKHAVSWFKAPDYALADN